MEKQGPRKLKSIQMAIPNKKSSTHSQDGLEAWKPFVPQTDYKPLILGMPHYLGVAVDERIKLIMKAAKGGG